MERVPEEWWQEACEAVRHPLACVSPDHVFVWTNAAYQRLVGYSQAELAEMTWLDITLQSDVGGDLASVKEIMDGRDSQYAIAKRYRHKLGEIVPVEIRVWKFPLKGAEIVCFVVEATQEAASQQMLADVQQALDDEIKVLKSRCEMLEDREKSGVNVSYTTQKAETGGSNMLTTNSSKLMGIFGLAILGLGLVVMVLMLNGVFEVKLPDGTDVKIESQEAHESETNPVKPSPE